MRITSYIWGSYVDGLKRNWKFAIKNEMKAHSHTSRTSWNCHRVDQRTEEENKVAHVIKGVVAENIYQALLTKAVTTNELAILCQFRSFTPEENLSEKI